MDDTSQPVLARATVHLPGLPLGRISWVDPSVPYVAAALKAEHLVLVEESTVDDEDPEE